MMDDDGIDDSQDNCPNTPNNDQADADGDGISDTDEARATNRDTDGDGTPDYVDTDSDGVCDDTDPCPNDNPDDTDLDGVCDSSDVCDGNDATAVLAEAVNASGHSYVTASQLGDTAFIRVSVGQTWTEERHVDRLWDVIAGAA